MATQIRPAEIPTDRGRALRATAWMFGMVVSFLLLMIATRELSTKMSSMEILTFRSIVGIPIMCVVAWYLGFHRIRSRRPGAQLLRNLAQFSGQWCWVFAVATLPMGNVVALEFTTPMWTAIIAALALGESFRRHRAIAIAFGFAGTLVILRPGIEIVNESTLVMLLGALLFAVSNVMVKSMTADDPPWVIVFWMMVIQCPVALVPAVVVFDWVWPTARDIPWLAAVGVTSITAHFCMARAFLLADATFCIPFDFIRLPLAIAIGWLLYTESVSHWVFAGAVIIFAANYYSIWRETRGEDR